MDHAEGSKIYDIDGNEYIDYVLSWGPLILGHKNKQVIEKLHEAVDNGTVSVSTLLKINLQNLSLTVFHQKRLEWCHQVLKLH